MSTLPSWRRERSSRRRCRQRGDGAIRLWYVEGFAVDVGGRPAGTVELVLPTLDGARPGALLVRLADGTGALLQAGEVETVAFGARRVTAAAEPVAFDADGLDDPRSPCGSWPAATA